MKTRLIRLLATGFGVGYSPVMPGTFGSVWGVLLYYVLRGVPRFPLILIGFALGAFAIYVAHHAERSFAEKDCQKIVIDEIAGQYWAFLLVPYDSLYLLLGFILFRFFDMLKIFPANWAQKHLSGGFGVVGDDLIAGLQAAIVLFCIYFFGWKLPFLN